MQTPLIPDFTPEIPIPVQVAETRRIEALIPDHLHGTITGAVRCAEIAAEEGVLRRDPCFEIVAFGWRILLRAEEEMIDVDRSEINWSRWEAQMIGLDDPQGLPVSFPIEVKR